MRKPILLLLTCFFACTLASSQSPAAPPPQPRAPYTGSPVPLSLVRAELSQHRLRSPAELRATMLKLVGPLPTRTPLHPVVLGQTSLPGMRIEKIVFDSHPGFHVPALLYLPDRTLVSGTLPAILLTPGHYPTSKAHDFEFASAFARNGFAVLSYDPLGQGERIQYPDPKDPNHTLLKGQTGEHGEASLQPTLLGESLAKYFLWDGMRALDYLQTRPEIDPHRIGALGCSGGGADTALLAATDSRVAAVGTACYLTSWDALLSTLGPQEGEQTTPGWISAGLSFADYVIAAAPRPYAIIATESDMFPFSGTLETEREARAYYGGIGAERQLAFIHGPGGHGNLKPILPRILRFFIDALQPTLNAPVYDDQSPVVQPPPGALQVTPTGQVSTYDRNAETVFSLNLKHAATLRLPHPESFDAAQSAVRTVVLPNLPVSRSFAPRAVPAGTPAPDPSEPWASFGLSASASALSPGQFSLRIPRAAQDPRHGALNAILLLPPQKGEPPALALLLANPDDPAIKARAAELTATNHLVLLVAPEPISPGNAEIKAPQLGPWYIPGLSAQLTGTSILGLRVADTLLAIDYLTNLRLPHQPGITAEASGHLALVLLHAAMFDTDPALKEPSRLTKVILRALPPTYDQLLRTPIPVDAAEDLIPGVLLHYDTPDLLAALGRRVVLLP